MGGTPEPMQHLQAPPVAEDRCVTRSCNGWSGREDSNLRLLRPERSTLPG